MSDNKYLDDNSTDESYYEEGLINPKTLMIGAALLTGSRVAYKKGLLKPLFKEGLELTAEHKPKLSVGFNEMRRWLKSNEGVPENSLFRTSIKDIAGSVLKQDKDTVLDIINATKEDVGIFTKMFNDTLDRIHQSDPRDLVINNYTNTSILNDQKRGAQEVRKYSQAQSKSRITMRSKVYDSIFETHHRTDEQLKEQLKRTGYRPVTASDILEERVQKDGSVKFFENSKFNFSTKGKNEKKAPIEHFENMFNHEVYTDAGEKIFKNKKQYTLRDKYNPKNIILDENLLIDDAGKIIDLRAKKRELNKSLNNLATEWKIPVINLNPLSMLGLDKKGRPKVNFGFISEDSVAPALTGIRGNSVKNTIRNVKENHELLKDVKEGVMIINGDVYTVAGEKGIKKLGYKYKKNLTYIPESKAHNTGSLTILENAQRKMQGISNASYNDFTQEDGKKYIHQKIAKTLDIGRQEGGVTKDKLFGVMDRSNPDSYVEKFLSKIGLSIKPYESKIEYTNFTEMLNPGFRAKKQDALFVTNQSITLKDLKVNKFNKDMVWDYGKQYIANFNKDSELVNNKTGVLHFIGDRLNTAISPVGLGMSLDSLASPVSAFGNIITKRLLPIYGAYQGWNMLNAITEGEDENGQRTNINRTLMEGYSKLDIGASYVKDKLGVTNFAKELTELMPGYDQLEELPVVTNLNLHETAEERADYWEYGKDPVRKSRYWSVSSSTSFTGGKVNYFKLNPLQAAKSDAVFSDSQFGSRREYFANVLNPYHYDNKHYQDRPYLMTSPAFENVPIVGDILAGTVGKVVKPQVKMHKEYWNEDGSVKTSKQINGDQAIYNANQQRLVSKGVSDFMNKEAGITVEDIYKKSFMDRIKDYTASAKQKAIEIVQSSEERFRKINNNSFEALFGENSIYSTQNLSLEDATINVTEPYSNIQARLQEMKKPDDSDYYNDPTNYDYKTYIEDSANMYEDIRSNSMSYIDNSIVTKKARDIYQASGFNYLPKTDYSTKQIPLASDLVPQTQELGNTILTIPQEGSSSYLGAVGSPSNYNYPQPQLQIPASESGAVLGSKKDFGKMINFDKEYDLSNRNMVYRTGSGSMQIVNTGKEIDPLSSVNLNKESPMSFIGGGNKGVSLNSDYIINKNDLNNRKEQKIENPNGLESTIRNQMANFENVAGIYGFAFNTAVTGEDNQKGRTVIDTPGWSRSFNKTFWDQDVGGFGGDISEIFRRLVQKRTTNGVEYYNPVKNTMPDWMPGENGFINFQEGDPYSKIARGEERLPGEGFERAYGINVDDYTVTSSRLGKSREELIEHFLERDDITEDYQQDIVKKGTQMHEKVEKYMLDNHIAIDSEKEIWDKKNNISGIYDVRIVDETSASGESIIDIKTIGDEGFKEVVNKGLPKEEHVKQVNFYLHNTNKNNDGGILYVNRDNPDQMYMTKFKYSEKLYNDVLDNVNYARNEVKSAIDSGQISRAERYKPIDKMRILADVAPYSTEYDDMKKYVRSMDLNEDQKKEVQNIEAMVTQQRKQLRTYDYRFKTADVKKSNVKITRQIDDNKFMTDDYDNPIKLAGVDLPNKTDDKERHEKAMAFINKNVKGHVEVKVAKDEHLRTNKDTLETMNAVVYSNGMNINRELIKRGLADEKKDDYSAAGVHARFNSLQRNFGSAWETIAHQNTIVNSKLLRVRSAKEDYERQQVYGKDWKSWTHPVQDFIKPMIWSSMNDETGTDKLLGAVGGAAIGSFFGGAYGNKARAIGAIGGAVVGGTTGTSIAVGAFTGSLFGRSKFGKLIGAAVGASTVAGVKAYKTGYEGTTGKKWTPKEKRRENEVIDYLDKLEFIKNRRMFEVYSQKALKEDGIDVRKLIADSKEKGDKAKSWSKKIEKIKKEQKKSGKFDTKEYEKAGLEFDENDKRHPLLRKDEANEKEKLSIKSKKKAIKEERKKIKDKYSEIILDNVEYSKDNNYNLKSEKMSKKDKKYLKKQKENVSKKEEKLEKATKSYMKNAKKRKQKALETTVNQRIEKAKTSKEITMTSPNAMKAIEYYNKSEQTMYGYDPGESISNFVAALPKKDKKYFNEFLKAGEKERKEILEMAPKYMKRALQSSYGLEVDEKEDLSEYFAEHYLPDENWDGWQESYDFDAIRTKVISKQGFNLASHDIWEDDKYMADMYGQTPIPNINHQTQNIQIVKSQLMSVLGEAGFKDLDITVGTGSSRGGINLDLYEDRKEKFEEKIRERLGQ